MQEEQRLQGDRERLREIGRRSRDLREIGRRSRDLREIGRRSRDLKEDLQEEKRLEGDLREIGRDLREIGRRCPRYPLSYTNTITFAPERNSYIGFAV